jgi:hypothetical protein
LGWRLPNPQRLGSRHDLASGQVTIANNEAASLFVNPCRVLVEEQLHFPPQGHLQHLLSRSLANQGVQWTAVVVSIRERQAFTGTLGNRNRISIVCWHWTCRVSLRNVSHGWRILSAAR